MFSSLLFPAAALLASSSLVSAQVTATGTMGVTNPAQPSLGTYNQTSMVRLLSVNSYDDFCLFGPPENGPDSEIGETEAEEVAWCTKPRNGARLIPDGTFYAIHFVKTPLYVQITGWGDFTKLNIPYGDEGGELDPHGATGLGNPVGGNVTSNVTGSDVNYEEWMNYMAYNQFCIRVCTAENSTYSAAVECEHTFDLMGCEWVMPGDYTNGTYTSCDGDAAYPPGVYPVGSAGSGTTSTFAQRYTNTASGDMWTIGDTVTPQTAFLTPASSNCVTYSSPSNGVLAVQTAGVNSTAAGSVAASAGVSAGASGTTAAQTGSGASGVARATNSASASSTGSAGFRTATAPSEVSIVGVAVMLVAALGGAAFVL